MATTVGKKDVAHKKSGHRSVGPPAVSNVPPMTPPKPDGVPAPFVYVGNAGTASETSSKLKIRKGKAVRDKSLFKVDLPGNQMSQPAPIHDLVTLMVNKKILIEP
jgi:hypothetical protein